MAQLSSLELTGKLGNLSAYKRRGSDKIIIRTKGGPSKEKIKHSPSFANTRKNNVEFGGRSSAAKWIRTALQSHNKITDHNLSAALTTLLKPVQEADTTNEFGRRSICLSTNPGLLEGFNLNKKFLFDAIMINPLRFEISRTDFRARVTIPALYPGLNFRIPGNYSSYCFVIALGAVPDLHWRLRRYMPLQVQFPNGSVSVNSEWRLAKQPAEAITLEIAMRNPPPADPFSLLLSVGINFGHINKEGVPQEIRYAGSAKILAAI